MGKFFKIKQGYNETKKYPIYYIELYFLCTVYRKILKIKIKKEVSSFFQECVQIIICSLRIKKRANREKIPHQT